MYHQQVPLILMLVNTHVYDDPRVMSEAVSLIQAGYQVHIIGAARLTGMPTRKNVNGVEVVLTPMITSNRPAQLFRAFWSWLRADVGITTQKPPSLTSNVMSVLWFNLWVLRLGIRIPADVIHCHDASPLPTAWILARLRRARFIYDSHESAPDLYTGRKSRNVARMEKALIGKPNVVITVGERLARSLRQRGGRRVVVIGNWKRLDQYQVEPAVIEAKRQQWNLREDELVISYIGDLTSTAYDLMPLLNAVCNSPNVILFIAGRGELEHTIQETARTNPNIHWLGYLNIAEVPIYTRLADVVYCCIHPSFPQAQYVAPNKLFEAFAAGKALIARRGIGELGEILENVGGAVLIETVNPDTLTAAFRQLQDPQTLKRLQSESLAARETYNWGESEKRLQALYAELLTE